MEVPQINMVAAVGIGGAIGPAEALPQIINKEEAQFFERWFMDLTRHGIIVLGHRSLGMMQKRGFRNLGSDWQIACWTRNGVYDPDEFITELQTRGKPIFIAGGRNTFEAFMPYVTQFFIRRVGLEPPHDNYLPPLFGRLQ